MESPTNPAGNAAGSLGLDALDARFPDQMADTATSWLVALRQMASALGQQKSFQSGLSQILDILCTQQFLRPHLVLFDPESGLLRLSLTQSPPKDHHSEYEPGVGVTGQVFATGKPCIIPCIAESPLFLGKLFARTPEECRALAFLSVPVFGPPAQSESALDAPEVIGTLNADCLFFSEEDLDLRCRFLEVVAAFIAHEAAHQQDEIISLAGSHTPLAHDESLNNSLPTFVAQSKKMRLLLEQAARRAQSHNPVLLRGEPGVGKERLALRMHKSHNRLAQKPFHTCYCASAPEKMEEELLGLQKGLNSAAMQSKKGLFEADGTLFLDSVETLPLSLQQTLLAVLDGVPFCRLGDDKPLFATFHLIASSSADLESLVEQGLFLPGLFARFKYSTLLIPPLRERREDIIPLAEEILANLAAPTPEIPAESVPTFETTNYSEIPLPADNKAPVQPSAFITRISFPALDMLCRYYWPGNVRELIFCMERAARICNDHVIRAADLPPSIQNSFSETTPRSENTIPMGDQVAHFEREILVDALIKAGGNMQRAAQDLKASYRIVNYKIKKYGIDPRTFSYKPRKRG